MKKTFFKISLLLTIAILFNACGHPAGRDSSELLFNTALNNTYVISDYSIDNENTTILFENNTITFNDNSSFDLVSSNTIVSGTWSTTDSIDGPIRFDDDEPGIADDRFIFYFENSDSENQLILAKEWRVSAFSDASISLFYNDTEMNTLEYLTLEKQ